MTREVQGCTMAFENKSRQTETINLDFTLKGAGWLRSLLPVALSRKREKGKIRKPSIEVEESNQWKDA